MAHSVADLAAEGVQDDLPNNEEEDAEGDITKRPAILKRTRDEQNLHGHVHKELHRVKQVQHNEKPDGVGRSEANGALESRERDEEADSEGNEGDDAQHPDGQRRAILVELETDKAVDEQARHECTAQTVLDTDKIRPWFAPRWNDTSIDNQADACEEDVEVEKRKDLLATDGSEL